MSEYFGPFFDAFLRQKTDQHIYSFVIQISRQFSQQFSQPESHGSHGEPGPRYPWIAWAPWPHGRMTSRISPSGAAPKTLQIYEAGVALQTPRLVSAVVMAAVAAVAMVTATPFSRVYVFKGQVQCHGEVISKQLVSPISRFSE